MTRSPVRLLVGTCAVAAFALSVCGAAADEGTPAGSLPGATVTTEAPPATTVPAPGSSGPAAPGTSEPPGPGATSTEPEAPAGPAWQTLEIVDVDGATFTIADLRGTPVLVETFATWCSNCRAQLGRTQEAARTLGDEAIVLALSVETDLSPGAVADYAAKQGFADIRFAVMSPELLAAFADAFGTTVANPPSTPKIVVDSNGDAGDLKTGSESSEEIVAQLRAAA